MASSDWEKQQRHQELLNSQSDIRDAINSQASSARESAEDIISALEEDREFKMFWDTLNRAEKKQWLKDREEEERRQRKAEERRYTVNFYSGSDFTPSRGWLSILAMLVGSLPTFGIQFLLGNIFLSIVTGFVAYLVLFGLLLSRKSKVQFALLLESRYDAARKLSKGLLAEIDAKIEENRIKLIPKFLKALTKGLFNLPVYFLAIVLTVSPLADGARNAFGVSNAKTEALIILEELNAKSGSELAKYIKSSMPNGTIHNSQEWEYTEGYMLYSSYSINADLQDPNLTFSESPYFPTLSGDYVPCATSIVSNDAKFYELETGTTFTSLRSQEQTQRNKFIFVEESGKLYPFLDICGLKYWGAAFFNQERIENLLFDQVSSTSTSYWDHYVSCPPYLFGTVGQTFECDVFNQNGVFDSRIKATISGLNPPDAVIVWPSFD